VRKVIGAINMTMDGLFDHTLIDPDEEIHQHYADLLNNSGVALYGRITYQLMQFWQTLVKDPSGEKSMDEFAVSIDSLPKIVFSHHLKDTGWNSAKLAKQPLMEEVLELRKQPGKDILVGSRSIIMQLIELHLIDEFQLCIHPVVAGEGTPLFEKLKNRNIFNLKKTKKFNSGAVALYYELTKSAR
jgi:dihydrofolate reductase